jgi:hypothetical protein
LYSGPEDNVFVYFTDHGATGEFCSHNCSSFHISILPYFFTGLVAFPNGVVSVICLVFEKMTVVRVHSFMPKI